MKNRHPRHSVSGTATKLLGAAALVAATLVPVTAATSAAPQAAVPSYCTGFETLPGCSDATTAAASTTGWSTETIAGMSVHLYTPATAPALGDQRALMINLHGCVQTATTMKNGANWQAVADDYGMVVAIPAVPNGGVIAGCWDYYDTNHSSTYPARHDDNLIDLATELAARDTLNVDDRQVYISGLSSGGGESMVMGCLAPQIFAGMGLNAGPTVGTTSSQIGSVSTTQAAGQNTCTTFAGSHADHFDTQLTSVVYGDNDTVVAPGYNTLNAAIMAGIYGASTQAGFPLAGLQGTNTNGSGTVYSDARGPRVSLIQNTGLGHNWPAGGGSGGSYISTNSINYPAYITQFFFENNRRVDSTDPTPTPTPTPEPTPAPEPTATPAPTTTPTESPTPESYCGTAMNAEHEAAGRAISYGTHPYNPYYAVGSQDYLGQGDTTLSTLQETSDGKYRLVASCN